MKFKNDVSVEGQITVTTEPTADSHVATKLYVDNAAPPVVPLNEFEITIISQIFS
jgi:hypothetical protein